MPKARSKAAYMISAVAEQYQIHPQTLRLYEREGLLAPSRSEGNTRLYTDDDLERLEGILGRSQELLDSGDSHDLARQPGVGAQGGCEEEKEVGNRFLRARAQHG